MYFIYIFSLSTTLSSVFAKKKTIALVYSFIDWLILFRRINSRFHLSPFSLNFCHFECFSFLFPFSFSSLLYSCFLLLNNETKKKEEKDSDNYHCLRFVHPFNIILFSFLPVLVIFLFFSRFLTFFLNYYTGRHIFLFSVSVTPQKAELLFFFLSFHFIRKVRFFVLYVRVHADTHTHIHRIHTFFLSSAYFSGISFPPYTAATVAKTMVMLMMTMNDRNTDVLSLITHSLIHTLQQYVNPLFFFLLRLTAVPHPLPHNCSKSPLPTEKVPPPTFTFSLPPFQTFTTEATHSIERAAKRVSAMATSSS